jgi:hypothetical protein
MINWMLSVFLLCRKGFSLVLNRALAAPYRKTPQISPFEVRIGLVRM